FGMAGISKFVFPFPHQNVYLVFSQITNKPFDVFTRVLVVFGVIMNGSMGGVRPVCDGHSSHKGGCTIVRLNKLAKRLHAVKQTRFTRSTDGDALARHLQLVTLIPMLLFCTSFCQYDVSAAPIRRQFRADVPSIAQVTPQLAAGE